MSPRTLLRPSTRSAEPPRIAVDMRMLGLSGIGRYLTELVPRLAATGLAEFHLLGSPASLERHGLGASENVVHHPARSSIYTLTEQWELGRTIPDEAELVWSPHFNIPLVSRKRLLVTIHDVFHLARPEYVQGMHRRLYARAMFTAVRAKAAHIICDSHFTASELMRLVGVDASAISVIHLGVSPSWFAQDDGAPPHPRPYFLYLGNVKPHKNLVRLVQAFAIVADELPHDLVIVGRREGFITGDERVAEQASRIGDRVHFTGHLDDPQVHAYVGHAEALVFPSLYEGFGLPPLEAMASGCPVLTSTAASLPEVCGDAALYCDALRPEDIAAQLRRLAREPGLREEMIGKGREHARRFSWDRCAAETAEVLRSVLADG